MGQDIFLLKVKQHVACMNKEKIECCNIDIAKQLPSEEKQVFYNFFRISIVLSLAVVKKIKSREPYKQGILDFFDTMKSAYFFRVNRLGGNKYRIFLLFHRRSYSYLYLKPIKK